MPTHPWLQFINTQHILLTISLVVIVRTFLVGIRIVFAIFITMFYSQVIHIRFYCKHVWIICGQLTLMWQLPHSIRLELGLRYGEIIYRCFHSEIRHHAQACSPQLDSGSYNLTSTWFRLSSYPGCLVTRLRGSVCLLWTQLTHNVQFVAWRVCVAISRLPFNAKPYYRITQITDYNTVNTTFFKSMPCKNLELQLERAEDEAISRDLIRVILLGLLGLLGLLDSLDR